MRSQWAVLENNKGLKGFRVLVLFYFQCHFTDKKYSNRLVIEYKVCIRLMLLSKFSSFFGFWIGRLVSFM